METPVTRQLEDRLGAVLQRLADVERRAATGGERSPTIQKLLSDFRRLADDMEEAFTSLRDAMARQRELQHDVETASRRAAVLLELSPVPWLVVDRGGLILDANAASGRALNVSQRRLVGRSFELFLDSEREEFTARLAAVGEGDRQRWNITLRPRERSPKAIAIVASPESDNRVVLILDAAEPAEGADAAAESV